MAPIVASIEIAYCDPDSPLSLVPGNGPGCDKIYNWATFTGKLFQPINGGQGIGSFPVVLNNGSVGVLFNSLTAPPCSPNECLQGTVGVGTNEWTLIPGAGATAFGSPLPAAPAATKEQAGRGRERHAAGRKESHASASGSPSHPRIARNTSAIKS